MGSSFISPPAKRSIYTATVGMLEPNSPSTDGVSFKRSKPPPPHLAVRAGHVVFRLLCHVSRTGGVIGKSGNIIKQLQQDTAAKIRVEESPPGCDERVIVVVASDSVNKRITLSGAEEEQCEVSAAQEAVVRVFERILDVAAELDGVPVGPTGVVACRLLVETSQVGSVIGKGGKIIAKIREDSGCKIRVLSSEKLPSCASPSDSMVEIEGDVLAVKKALVAVSRRLQDCLPVVKTKMTSSRPPEAVPYERFPDPRVDFSPQRSSALPYNPTSSLGYASGGRSVPVEFDRVPVHGTRTQQQEVVFKLLCSNDRVGGVIGKGGLIVRGIQNESGATINFGSSLAECDERLITVTAVEYPESQYSAAQKAAVLLFSRSIETGIEKGIDSGKGAVSARLVVSRNQVGCLMGKGGAIISEMRKATGAGISIIASDQVPKCASKDDEVVQITGEFGNVQDAVYNVTSRLRVNIFSNKTPNVAGTRSNSSVIPETSPYGRVRDPPSLGFHSSTVSHSLSRHTVLAERMDHLGISSNFDYPPSHSPRSWASQKVGGVNPRSSQDIGRGLTSFKGGVELGSGSKSAIVTSTTVEISVPENVIGSVYGDNGSNLTRLRQISGAKVTVHEPRPGTTERIVIISGTPDETQAAQSLLQAFILTGPS